MRTVMLSALVVLCLLIGNLLPAQTCGVHSNFSLHDNGNNNYSFFDSSAYDPQWVSHPTNLWSFDGGITWTTNGSNYQFPPIGGTYTVCHVAVGMSLADSSVCMDTFCRSIFLPCALVTGYSFTLQASDMYQPNSTHLLTDNFVSHYSPSHVPVSYAWDFGDSTTSTLQNPVHTYGAYGSRNVCVTVTEGNGCVQQFCNTINNVLDPCAGSTNCSFIISQQPGYVMATKTGGSSAFRTQWTLDDVPFTDKIASTGIDTFGYIAPGSHRLCEHIYSGPNHECDSVCSIITITDSCLGANPNFTSILHTNDTVQFIGMVTNPNAVNYWDFGDGPSDTSANAIHHFMGTSVLQYVCHTVIVLGTSCVNHTCQNVSLNGTCHAGFTYAGDTAYAVSFQNTSIPGSNLVSWHWDFGDGDTTNVFQPTHTYPDTGYYTVCLSLNSAYNCYDTFCTTVHPHATNPCAGLTAAWNYTVAYPDTVRFVGLDTISSSIDSWTFGDGGTSSLSNPQHVYSNIGSTVLYYVCHTVSLPGTSCSLTSCRDITIGQGCSAHFNWQYADTTFGINFTNNSNNGGDTISSYLWQFGDGTTSTQVSPMHLFPDSGYYHTCLNITTVHGCQSSHCDSIHPFIANPCNGLTAAFSDTLITADSMQFVGVINPNFSHQWSFGDGTFSTDETPVHYFLGTAALYYVCHTVTVPGTTCTAYNCQTIPHPNFHYNDTACGTVFEDLNANGVYDVGEPPLSGVTVYNNGNPVITDANGHYTMVVVPGYDNITYCADSSYSITLPIMNVPQVHNCAGYSNLFNPNQPPQCGFDFGVRTNTVTICGTVFLDANNNGLMDGGEPGVVYQQVRFTNSHGGVYQSYTDAGGNYCITLPTETYTIVLGYVYGGGTATPSSYTVVATSSGNTYSSNNFGIYQQPGGGDFSVTLISLSPCPTPGGSNFNYVLRVCNNGPGAMSGTLQLWYDSLYAFNSSSVSFNVNDTINREIIWNNFTVLPGNCADISLNFTPRYPLVLGENIVLSALIISDNGYTDNNVANNEYTIHQQVGAPFDPNNKQVNPIGEGADGRIDARQELTYTIEFENTGSAPAVNVIVRDTIDAGLDINTLHMLGASRACNMQVQGQVITWQFNNIMLPPVSVDSVNGRGIFSYAIKPLSTLSPGTPLRNDAAIYFDEEAPIFTNTTLNTINYLLSVNQLEIERVTITIQPNPFTTYTNIVVDGMADNNYELKIFDAMGKMVRAMKGNNGQFRFERGDIASGVYLLQVLQNGQPVGKGKLVVE